MHSRSRTLRSPAAYLMDFPISRPIAKRYRPSMGMGRDPSWLPALPFPSPSSRSFRKPSFRDTRWTLMCSPSSGDASKSGPFGSLYGLSRSTTTTTHLTVSSHKPGDMQTRGETTGRVLQASPTYPVSSRSSRSAACSGVSPASIKPAGNSSVAFPTGGRNCSTRSVSRVPFSSSSSELEEAASAYGRFSSGTITTASAAVLSVFVVLVA
mmetsp:Transcript_3425/g.9086  ORF Transcript_3425/g.9086 Transcript_3425/m.9086 type:complete len:210 (+) Transcript_3425:242-871(+)